MKYKINIHAHTIFSDGISSPYVMALEAKRLGFSALVITDHFYGRAWPGCMNENSYKTLKKACREAKSILPIIIGMEVPFMGQEVLVFGGAVIKWILENGRPNMNDLLELKSKHSCAVIMCHPGDKFDKAAPAVDGFEAFNSGNNFFQNDRPFGLLDGKQAWCNSDAHHVDGLKVGYNIIDSKIETEHDLIKYIKRGVQPDFVVKK